MESEVVHSETCNSLLLEISAKYKNDCSIKVNGDWYVGRVTLYCKIFDNVGNLVIDFDSTMGSFHRDSLYCIAYGRKHERYGFLKLKKNEYLIHISEEYDRVYPLFLDYCRAKTTAMATSMYKERDAQRVTDGLPDSLKEL